MKKTHRLVNRERRFRERQTETEESKDDQDEKQKSQPKFYEIRPGEEFTGLHGIKKPRINK